MKVSFRIVRGYHLCKKSVFGHHHTIDAIVATFVIIMFLWIFMSHIYLTIKRLTVREGGCLSINSLRITSPRIFSLTNCNTSMTGQHKALNIQTGFDNHLLCSALKTNPNFCCKSKTEQGSTNEFFFLFAASINSARTNNYLSPFLISATH